MGWFDEQIKLRHENDDEMFSDAMKDIARIVEGKPAEHASYEDEYITNAMSAVLGYFHVKGSNIPASIKEQDEKLEYLCRPHGIMRRNVELTKAWHKDAIGPMLGKKKDGTVVAFIPDKLWGYRCFDESVGRHIRINKHNEGMFEKEAVVFYKPFPQKKLTIPLLLKYIYDSIPVSSKLLYLLFTLIVSLIGLLSPKVTHIIFSDIITNGNIRLVLAVTVLSLSVAISSLLFSMIKKLILDRINIQLNISVEAACMARIMSLPAGFFKKYSSGDLANRQQSVESLCSILVSTILSTGFTSLFSLVYIVQIFRYAKALVVPALVIIAVTIVFSLYSSFRQMKISEQQMKLSSKRSGMTYSMLTGIQKIKLSGSEKRMFARWLRLYSKESELQYRPPFIILFNGVISGAISLIGTIVMYYFSVQSGISVADYYAFNTAYGMVSGAFMSVAGIALTLADIRPILEMAKPILETVPEVSEGKRIVTALKGNIELNNVSFKYSDNMPNVIDDLSLKIKAGQYVAVVGKTGCGKSTLMRLLLGFEKPQKGAVYYDGHDITSLDLKSLRHNIGSVMQDGKLFYGDIYSNIVISAPQLSRKAAWEAAELAGIADDIRDMPMGMNTIISEGAGGISGGQRQRLMIARAIAPKPKILLFDEATSALDNITQKQISDALYTLKCTRIVIAHRLSTIKQCDRIIVLDGGKIIEDGTYDELISKKGFFAKLVARQKVDSE